MQAANDEEGGGGLVVQRTWGPEDLFPGWHVANEIMKPQLCINSNDSSLDCKKTATGHGNLQPEVEINEYSSSN